MFKSAEWRADERDVTNRFERLRSQEGFTLVELLVAGAVMLVVFAASVTYLAVASRSEVVNYNRSDRLEEMSVALKRFTHDARDARSVWYLLGGQGRKVRITLRSGETVDYECVEDAKTTCVRIHNGQRTILAKGLLETDNTFVLSCRHKDPSHVDTGKLMHIPNSGAIPSDCDTSVPNPVSYVDLRLIGTLGCEGEGRTGGCPPRRITLHGGVALRNAG